MRTFVAAFVAALLCLPAFAGELMMRNKENGAELRLYESQCSHAQTMALLNEEWRPKFKNARIRDPQGNILYACRLLVDEETVVLFVQDGSFTSLKLSDFSDPNI